MIKTIVLEHFKSIERLEIDLPSIAVLVGPNSVGKSNFVDALRFIKDAVRYDLDRAVSDRHGIDSIRQWSPSRPYNVGLLLKIQGRHGEGEFSCSLGSSKRQYIILKEEGMWRQKTDIFIGFDEDITEDSDSSENKEVLETSTYFRNQQGKTIYTVWHDDKVVNSDERDIDFKDDLSIQVNRPFYFVSGISQLRRELQEFEAYSIFPNTLRTPQPPSNEQRLTSSGDNLASIFRQMSRSRRGAEARAEIISAMKMIVPKLDNIAIQSLGGYLVPLFRVKEASGRTHNLNVSQMSDGSLRVLGLLTALYQPSAPRVIAMEEPEQNIHPGALSILSEAIKEVSKKSQIIITTHSPNFVDFFDPDVIFAVEMINGISHIGPISETQKKAVIDHLFTVGELMNMEGLTSK